MQHTDTRPARPHLPPGYGDFGSSHRRPCRFFGAFGPLGAQQSQRR